MRHLILNLQDDNPTMIFGPRVEDKDNGDDGEFCPFFIGLNIHDMVLHNTMLDSMVLTILCLKQ